MKEAEAEMEKTSTGIIAWVKKVIRPSISAGSSRVSLPAVYAESDVRSNDKSANRAGNMES